MNNKFILGIFLFLSVANIVAAEFRYECPPEISTTQNSSAIGLICK
jgi:hypothetical protein